MSQKLPPVREDHDYIEIDAKTGKWPFVRAMWGIDGKSGKRKMALIVDENDEKTLVNDGVGVAVVVLSAKRARALYEFLGRTL